MFSDIIIKKSEISHTNSGIRGQEKKCHCKTFFPNNVILAATQSICKHYPKEIRTILILKRSTVQWTAVYTFHVHVPTMGFEPATSHTSIYTLYYKFKHHDHHTTNTLLGWWREKTLVNSIFLYEYFPLLYQITFCKILEFFRDFSSTFWYYLGLHSRKFQIDFR